MSRDPFAFWQHFSVDYLTQLHDDIASLRNAMPGGESLRDERLKSACAKVAEALRTHLSHRGE